MNDIFYLAQRFFEKRFIRSMWNFWYLNVPNVPTLPIITWHDKCSKNKNNRSKSAVCAKLDFRYAMLTCFLLLHLQDEFSFWMFTSVKLYVSNHFFVKCLVRGGIASLLWLKSSQRRRNQKMKIVVTLFWFKSKELCLFRWKSHFAWTSDSLIWICCYRLFVFRAVIMSRQLLVVWEFGTLTLRYIRIFAFPYFLNT